MGVPDLDWRADLFDDAVAVADDPIINRMPPDESQGALWPAMRQAWTGGAQETLQRKVSVMQISAARNAINVQRS